MSNDRDQAIVTSAISDTGSGLLEFLSALGQREAIAFGDGVSLPVRIRFDELPRHALPRSSTARFSEMWQTSTDDEGFLDALVDRWRLSSSGTAPESLQAAAPLEPSAPAPSDEMPASEPPPAAGPNPSLRRHADLATSIARQADLVANAATVAARAVASPPLDTWREGGPMRHEPASRAEPPPGPARLPQTTGSAMRSLRDRLSQRR
jgi:hypothetical protein